MAGKYCRCGLRLQGEGADCGKCEPTDNIKALVDRCKSASLDPNVRYDEAELVARELYDRLFTAPSCRLGGCKCMDDAEWLSRSQIYPDGKVVAKTKRHGKQAPAEKDWCYRFGFWFGSLIAKFV